MGTTSYRDKLKDPRWQKRRLEVLNRDSFSCQNCGDATSTLHVHHLFYDNDWEPWDYPGEALLTLCEFCHEEETINRRGIEQTLLLTLKVIGFMHHDIHLISDGFLKMKNFAPRSTMAASLRWILSNELLMNELHEKHLSYLKETYGS